MTADNVANTWLYMVWDILIVLAATHPAFIIPFSLALNFNANGGTDT